MQLTEQELESIYNLLHSSVEDNVNLALAIIEGREDVKAVFEEAMEHREKSWYDRYCLKKSVLVRAEYTPIQQYEIIEQLDLEFAELKMKLNYSNLSLINLQQAYSKIYAEN